MNRLETETCLRKCIVEVKQNVNRDTSLTVTCHVDNASGEIIFGVKKRDDGKPVTPEQWAYLLNEVEQIPCPQTRILKGGVTYTLDMFEEHLSQLGVDYQEWKQSDID